MPLLESSQGIDGFLAGGGRMGAAIRDHDWSATPLGPPATWPQSLRSALSICLQSSFPTAIYWGKELRLLYNDAWAPILAERHPWALGRPGAEVWADIWAVVGAQFEQVQTTGEGFSTFDQMLPMVRGGDTKETFWNYSLTPIRGEDGVVAGVFNQGHETTARILAERQQLAETERLRRMFDQAPGFMAMLHGPGHVFELANAAYLQLVGHRDVLGKSVRDALPEIEGQGFLELLDSVFATGQPFVGRALPVLLQRQPGGAVERRILDFVYQPVTDRTGAVSGIFLEGADVTERHTAETELRASEARLRALLHASSDVVFRMSPDWSEMRQLTGRGFVADSQVPSILWLDQYIFPEDRPLFEGAIDEAVRSGGTFELEHRVRRIDGSVGWLFSRAIPMRDPAGAVTEWFGMAADITSRKQAEAELRESLARHRALFAEAERRAAELRAVLESMPDAVYIGGVDGITLANQPALDQLGFATREELNRHVATLAAEIRTRDAQTGAPISFQDQAFTRAFHGERVVQDVRVRHRLTGEERVVRCAAAPVVVDGNVIAAVAVNTDITEQRRTEAQLRELNATLEAQVAERTAELRLHRDIIESHPTPICAFDTEMRLSVFNQAYRDEFLRIYGRRPQAGDCFPAQFLPAQALLVRGFVERALAGEAFTITGEYGDPGHALVHWESHYAPLRDAAGQIIGGFHQALDITDRVRAEAELRQVQDVLRQSQKMEAVGQLTGGIAHDFNNLLSAVVGGFDLIRLKPHDAERVRRIAENGLAAAERGAKLTGHLLTFSRAQKIEMKPVIVAHLVEGMRDMLVRTLSPQTRLVFELDQAAIPVLADPTQLEMAVLNLAINARDAMPEGGELTIRTVPRHISRDPELPAGEYVELSVTDNGMGMPPETAARAFDPFFTTKSVGKGTGLGLSQVYGMARQGGGTARVESRLGAGTTVRLFLPRTEAARPAPAVADPKVTAPEIPAATVLIVDDDDDVRSMVADSLRALGYGVAQAADGPAALAVLDRQGIDLVMVDFAMPGMNGAEVAEAIRDKRPGLPVVFVSGYADTAAIERAAGPNPPMLRKPFRIGELEAMVGAALTGRF